LRKVAPASTETPLHTHEDSDEIAYVLSGEITFKIGDEVTVGGPWTCAFVPRGLAHAWKNTGREPGRVLFLYSPGRAGKFFGEAAQMDRPFSPNDQQLAEAFKRNGWQIVGPPPF
jgi:quercetin dioxygenase-like cupin family protein